MERQARLELAQPERRIGADEVHLVAAVRQRLRELGGDDAAAADRRVADDADVHRFVGHGSSRFRQRAFGRHRCGSRTTTPSANGDAGEGAELRVAALDELLEERRRQPRRDRAALPRRVNWLPWQRERVALRLVVLGHVDDERRRRRVVDEVVADPLGPPRHRGRLVAAQAAVEDRLGQHLRSRRRDRDGDRRRTGSPPRAGAPRGSSAAAART